MRTLGTASWRKLGESGEEVVTEDEDDMGTNWEVIVRQHGFVVTLLIYV
jgi:hypothetical protein